MWESIGRIMVQLWINMRIWIIREKDELYKKYLLRVAAFTPLFSQIIFLLSNHQQPCTILQFWFCQERSDQDLHRPLPLCCRLLGFLPLVTYWYHHEHPKRWSRYSPPPNLHRRCSSCCITAWPRLLCHTRRYSGRQESELLLYVHVMRIRSLLQPAARTVNWCGIQQ